MSDPSQPASDDLLASGGGNATAIGVSFQAEVGAMFGVPLLGERRLDGRLGLGDVRVRSLRFETEASVDDILVETDTGGWIFVQAKSALTLSSKSDSELGRVVDQIVRQYHACAQGTGERGWDRPLQPRHDRILIAVGRGAAASRMCAQVALGLGLFGLGCFGPTDAIVDIFFCCVFGFLIAFIAGMQAENFKAARATHGSLDRHRR
jgi:hypothetical protein